MTPRPPLAERLDLQPHPEGGWFRETWRSPVSFWPAGYQGERSAATAIGSVTLGPDVRAGQQPQALVPGGTWQSAGPASDEPVLVSCVVAPGFDFADFRLG